MSSMIGVNEFLAALHKVELGLEQGSKEIVVKGSVLVVRASQAKFQGARKWGTGPRGGRALFPANHTGGDGPNVISGSLRRGITSRPIVRFGLGDYGVKVGPTSIYARTVELKYHYAFFVPAVEELAGTLRALAKQTWTKYL